MSRGRVIRAESTGPRIVPAVVAEVQPRAAELLERAQAKAEALVAQARADAERLTEQARAEGHAQGVARLAAGAADLASDRDRWLAQLEPQVVQLAMLAARQIVGEELALCPERMRAIVAPLIERLRRASALRLRLHPDDAAVVARQLPELLGDARSNARVQIESDATIARGGCSLVSDIGSLDARLEGRLEVMAAALVDTLRSSDRERAR